MEKTKISERVSLVTLNSHATGLETVSCFQFGSFSIVGPAYRLQRPVAAGRRDHR